MNLSRAQVLKIVRMADTQRERAREEFGMDDTFEHFVCVERVNDKWTIVTGDAVYVKEQFRFEEWLNIRGLCAKKCLVSVINALSRIGYIACEKHSNKERAVFSQHAPRKSIQAYFKRNDGYHEYHSWS